MATAGAMGIASLIASIVGTGANMIMTDRAQDKQLAAQAEANAIAERQAQETLDLQKKQLAQQSQKQMGVNPNAQIQELIRRMSGTNSTQLTGSGGVNREDLRLGSSQTLGA